MRAPAPTVRRHRAEALGERWLSQLAEAALAHPLSNSNTWLPPQFICVFYGVQIVQLLFLLMVLMSELLVDFAA